MNKNAHSDCSSQPLLTTPICLYSSEAYEKDSFIKFGKLISPNDIIIITNDNLIQRKTSLLNQSPLSYNTAFTFKESNFVYDYAILPNDSNQDDSLLFICSKGNPIRALGLSDGSIREVYTIKNHLDCIINPIFITVDEYGMNLYCGGAFLMKIDLITNQQLSIKLPSKQMTSCFSFNYRNSAYLIGSYDKKILLYDYKSNALSAECIQSHSVNQIEFSSKDANYFYVGYRYSNSMKLFDMRMMDQEVCEWYRDTKSSQRINFCFDEEERYLFSGGVEGNCLGYDLMKGSCLCHFVVDEGSECVNSVDYLGGVLLTTTGQRHFDIDEEGEKDNNWSACSGDEDGESVIPRKSRFKIWQFKSEDEVCSFK